MRLTVVAWSVGPLSLAESFPIARGKHTNAFEKKRCEKDTFCQSIVDETESRVNAHGAASPFLPEPESHNSMRRWRKSNNYSTSLDLIC